MEEQEILSALVLATSAAHRDVYKRQLLSIVVALGVLWRVLGGGVFVERCV